jgi:hypothetical protein
MTQIDQLIKSLDGAIRYEASRTEGLETTILLGYQLQLVVVNGDVTHYSIDKTEDSEPRIGG